jgi:hypothetical protein
MKTLTPRTNAEVAKRSANGAYDPRFVYIDFARELERELIAANAQIVALRSALDSLQDLVCDGGYTDAEFAAEMGKTNAALFAPSPPVVPLEDVTRLRDAIESIKCDARDLRKFKKFPESVEALACSIILKLKEVAP